MAGLVGCSKLSTEYGFSSGVKGELSLNGFAAMRKTYENAGFECRDVRRLSDRQDRVDTLVWTPQVLTTIDTEMTDWFDAWLSQGGHTLVYIVPDSGSEAEYWIDAQPEAPPSQAFEYRRRSARAINERFEWRLNRVAMPSNGWFVLEPLASAMMLDSLEGAWNPAVRVSEDERSSSIPIELQLRAYAPAASTSSGSTTTTASTATNPSTGSTGTSPASSTPVIHSGPTGPSDPYGYYMGSATPTATKVKFERLLSLADDSKSANASPVCFVGRITSPAWKESQVIVVAGGSLLTNYGFTQPFGRDLADKLVSASSSSSDVDPQAGFITSTYGSVPISEIKPDDTRASGMELLTTWPLSLVTMHAVFLGLVTCLILLPIFGRPRRVLRSSLSRFGDHLDAVAALMCRARGEEYARRRISEYHRRVRGETSGPWVLPETPHTNPSNEQPRAKS